MWGPEALTCTMYNQLTSSQGILEPEAFDISNTDCRHQKVLDLLDENGLKPLTTPKYDQASVI